MKRSRGGLINTSQKVVLKSFVNKHLDVANREDRTTKSTRCRPSKALDVRDVR